MLILYSRQQGLTVSLSMQIQNALVIFLISCLLMLESVYEVLHLGTFSELTCTPNQLYTKYKQEL